MITIVKATSKGQITLPVSWRRNFPTHHFVVKQKGEKLEIKAIDLKGIEASKEYTVFDAIRDNKGEGIKAKDLVKVLKKNI